MHCCRFASAVRIGDDLWKLPLNWAVFRLLVGIFSPILTDQTELLYLSFCTTRLVMSNLPTPTQRVSPCTLTGPLVQDRNNQCEMWKVLMYVWIFNKVFELDQMSSMSKVVLYLTLQPHQTHSCHPFRDL